MLEKMQLSIQFQQQMQLDRIESLLTKREIKREFDREESFTDDMTFEEVNHYYKSEYGSIFGLRDEIQAVLEFFD